MISFTRRDVEKWVPKDVFERAQKAVNSGAVVSAIFDNGKVTGTIRKQPRALKTQARLLPDMTLDNLCPCRDNRDLGIICWHIVAVCLDLVAQANDPERLRKLEMEKRRAETLSAYTEEEFLKRVSRDDLQAVEARLRVGLAPHWREGVGIDRIPVTCAVSTREHGTLPANEFPTDVPLGFDKTDENLLYVLEDICEGPVGGQFEVSREDFVNVLNLMPGKVLYGPNARVVNEAPQQSMKLEMDENSGQLVLYLEVAPPGAADADMPVVMFVGPQAGYAFLDKLVMKLTPFLPGPLQELYTNPVLIAREAVPRFLQSELAMLKTLMPVESQLSEEWLTTRPARPGFRLHVKGSPASLAATLYATYEVGEETVELVAGKEGQEKGQFAIPEEDDLLAYRVRNIESEKLGVSRMGEVGFPGWKGDELSPIVGSREVANFLGSHLPALRRRGWKVDLEGRVEAYFDEVEFVTPVVEVAGGDDKAEKSDWFEVGFEFELQDGSKLEPAEIQRAIRMGDSYVERGKKKIFFDRDAVESMQAVFRDCASGEASRPGAFRMKGIHAAYVKSSLDALDGVDIEAGKTWTEQAKRQNRDGRVTPVDVGPELSKILRPYQQEGVNWLSFWERNGYAGILADDMGLGKTLQTLTWLSLERSDRDLDGMPVLIVCPTSLVENWIEEAEKFVPHMTFLNITGPTRKERFGQIDEVDVAVTSYALVRRDFEELQRHDFACVVLDEAQHIKNPKSQSAKAVKKMRGHCKLVLTGTPVENRVTDLWSIMDFLMPGYLGSAEHFKTFYEGPISKGPGAGAEAALGKLRRKLHPFLLRRLKTEVAKDLPPKIEKVMRCSMTPDQKKVYEELRDHSRRKMFDLVDSKGFNKARMEILTMLLRLRQASCHVDLLKLDDSKPLERPSAKMELFNELLDEAMSGGHRMLVFSQFTSMLGLLREELEERGLRFCYLDGSTKNRQSLVKKFNGDPGIPVFLISLKAGGTGLNLTGADMVIHFDPWWNPAAENQATDRAYRIGQKRTVYAMKLIARDTVEEKVLEMQEKKRRVIDATLSGDEEVMEKLSWDDVKDLMEL